MTDDAGDGDVGGPYAAFAKFMESRAEADERKYFEIATGDGYADLLRDASTSHGDGEVFEHGSLVQWKPMMRDRPMPLEAVPAIVVDYIDPPAVVDSDGDPVVEPRDLLIGVVDGSRVYRLLQVPSARFTRWIA